ncbi:MAG: hypothetical protein JRJ13_14130 [Deltaproteobacteria bacterium]|nr:hypothetical protein [Deltaproteobacteria bacterium]
MSQTAKTPKPDRPNCPHCGSKWTVEVYREWYGELEDGSIAPQPIIWECLECSGFFTTKE